MIKSLQSTLLDDLCSNLSEISYNLDVPYITFEYGVLEFTRYLEILDQDELVQGMKYI